MSDIYMSTRDNVTQAEVIKIDERASTFMVRYLNGDKKGQTTIYSKGTMKRWWKKIEEVKKEIKKDVHSESGKMPSTECRKRELDLALQNLVLDVSWFSSVRCYKVKSENKTIGEIYPRRKHLEVRVHNKKDVPYECKDGYKYYLPVHYFIPWEENYQDALRELFV